jgi:hypothetical protein
MRVTPGRLLKNPPHGTRDASDRGRVICETKCILSHYLLLGREKKPPEPCTVAPQGGRADVLPWRFVIVFPFVDSLASSVA